MHDYLEGDYPGYSPYSYVLNNPVVLYDPTGLCPDHVKHGEVWNGSICYKPNGEVIEVTAERAKGGGSSSFYHDGVFYFRNNEEGLAGLGAHLEDNPASVETILSGDYSTAAQQVAFQSSISNGGAEFVRLALRISLETGADFATVVSMLSGTGTLAGAGAFLLRRGGINLLTKSSAVNLIKYSAGASLNASVAETGFRGSAVPLGGSRSAAIQAGVGLVISFATAGGALNPTGLAGPAFRSASTGRFVGDLQGISIFGGMALIGHSPAYYFYLNQ